MLENEEDKQEAFNWDTTPAPTHEDNVIDKTPQTSQPATNAVSTPLQTSQTHSIDITGGAVQLPLTEPLFHCRLGWVYDSNRVVNKRTKQPLKKKPSYRFAQYQESLYLGSHPHQFPRPYSALEYVLTKSHNRNLVVFVPEELWSRYPDSQSWTKPHGPTLLDNFPTKHEQQNYLDGNLLEYVTNITPDEPIAIRDKPTHEVTFSEPTHVDKPGFFQKIWNWINA